MLNKLSENTLVFGNMSISCCVFSVFLLSTLSSPLFLFLCLVMVSFTHNFNFYMRKHLKILLQIIRSCTCTMHNAPLALTVSFSFCMCVHLKRRHSFLHLTCLLHSVLSQICTHFGCTCVSLWVCLWVFFLLDHSCQTDFTELCAKVTSRKKFSHTHWQKTNHTNESERERVHTHTHT